MSSQTGGRHERVMELIEEFAIAVTPLLFTKDLNLSEIRKMLPTALGQTENSLRLWRVDVYRFLHSEGLTFRMEYEILAQKIRSLLLAAQGSAREIQKSSPDSERHVKQLRESVGTSRRFVRETLLSIPTDHPSLLIGPKSPYSAYLLIKAELLRARTRVHYFDRYLASSYFDLYLRKLPRDIEIKLITTKGRQGVYGIADVIAQAALAAKEFASLSLYEMHQDDLHDRNIRVDNEIFSLGPSLSHAGKHPLNFSKVDSSDAGHAVLDGMLSKSVEVPLA